MYTALLRLGHANCGHACDCLAYAMNVHATYCGPAAVARKPVPPCLATWRAQRRIPALWRPHMWRLVALGLLLALLLVRLLVLLHIHIRLLVLVLVLVVLLLLLVAAAAQPLQPRHYRHGQLPIALLALAVILLRQLAVVDEQAVEGVQRPGPGHLRRSARAAGVSFTQRGAHAAQAARLAAGRCPAPPARQQLTCAAASWALRAAKARGSSLRRAGAMPGRAEAGMLASCGMLPGAMQPAMWCTCGAAAGGKGAARR
jgi:hypothetical protein